MPKLFWKAQEELVQESWAFAQQSRIGRFLGVSTVLHAIAAAISPWLLLTFSLTSQEEQLIIRTVDFVLPPETAPVGIKREIKGGGGGGPLTGASKKASPTIRQPQPAPAPRAPGPSAQPKAADIPGPREIAAAPIRTRAGEPAPAQVAQGPASRRSGAEAESVKALAQSLTQAGDLPTLPAQPAPVLAQAVAGPRAIASSPAQAGPSQAGPSPVAATASPKIGIGSDGVARGGNEVIGLATRLSGGGGAGPVATVAIPRELVQGGGGRGGVGSGGGMGAGTGLGVGVGSGPGSGQGAGLVDTRDPDFSDYFHIIEQRVRAAWKFPDGLEGTTQTVKIGFSLQLDGSLREVRVVASTSGTLNESALAAVKRAAPFPPLPVKFRALTGQPLVMGFSVTIK